ncbi:bifunctional homocysteine S-methyltransferase/methylenetetrahydrofolate reductase [Aneurinibacillus aneurinilyticus]|jgi:homocysteine S-methyltransferase|uniref:Homocysteine S-methyltransferase/5,10-methylenetetrahydrofolate reductase protein n=1 Tax=Aneurinibacillus aneurinilyticus ATCC 12856 TaxID=649747 RepID=U1WZF3_ANEAE|nr:bifunctional homocysteine S-methyltransferase/methylenetetrahydrofolate reductase [Aneurinibacillus aneurinilyticus]ERI08090.1 homocysteine S-methyltransferase/5,10-methylenetetrahydrofolate reductase protein [Aneurinibacillus aneurinilyticus ATCC 12856]MCI1694394.1 bifunctional homocysteine S-methyltransferase/methylenetetrahydrofolate reductase [Aneurinibacillus aneurinilyticus]MED0670521.1 bifunctional homocysteine S-methyltransferase/methylenetetrahydrofolate reductase [Aneurinibacillus a
MVMPQKNLKTYLKDNLLIGDGAMATWLYRLGVPIGVCYEELNLSNPEIISTVHRSYYEAGARFIQTNTYGAHRDALSRHGLQTQVQQINRSAVQVARQAVGSDAYVVGGIGSINAGRVRNTEQMATYGDQYEEQASALLLENVDAILLETFLDVDELLLALDVIRPLTDLPIIAQLATIEVGRTRDGHTLTRAFAELVKAGADIVGLNCRMGPAEVLRSIEGAVVPGDTPLSVFPNAGRLAMSDGEYSYASVPQYFGDSALRFRAQGARLIGGCCGTTPEHIRMMAQVLAEREPLPRVNPEVQMEEEPIPIRVVPPVRPKGIVDTVTQRHTVIVELDPPRDLDTEKFLQGTAELRNAGADAITLADNSLATTRMSNLALGSIMKAKLSAEPLLHIACRDRNLIGQQSHLMGLHALGINQVLVITGDPARFGDLPGASSVFDVSSFDLIRMIKQLNEGYSFSGKPLKQRANFVVGAAFNPHVRQFDAALRRLEKKVEAGADYIMTQPVYDREIIEQIYEGTKHLNIPIFIGIMPLTSSRNAEFLHNEVPGIKLSDEARERMRQYEPGEEARHEGVSIARELVDMAMERFKGIYLITPFFYYQMTAELTRYIRKQSDVKLSIQK